MEPFLQAIERQSSVYAAKDIDMLKSAVSLPGLSTRWLFFDSPTPKFHELIRDGVSAGEAMVSSRPVCLIDESNSDLYHTVKSNIVGGPSIVFHRYHEKNVTRIRELEYGSESRLCERVLGVGANALYLWLSLIHI